MIHLFYSDGKSGNVSVDWLTLSLSIIHRNPPERLRMATSVMASACGALGIDYGKDYSKLRWAEVKNSPGYNESWSWPEAGTRIDYRTDGKILISWSGAGCVWLREKGLMERMMAMGVDMASRVDIALDVPDMRLPSQVVDIESLDPSRTSVLWRSPTGETLYLGSMKSKRYARLYRYTNKDHERYHFLRLETVYRNYVAQATCQAIVRGKILELVHTECNRLNLLELLEGAQLDATGEHKLAVYIKRVNPNTMLWMEHAVVPALQRLVDDGDISDAKAYIAELLEKLNKTDVPKSDLDG